MEDTTITLIYNDGGEGGSSTEPTNEGLPAEMPLSNKGSVKKLVGLSTIRQLGSTSLNYATSHVGKFTGSSHKQDIANGVMSMAGTAASIAANPILGTLNWLVGFVTDLSDYVYNKRWENYSLIENRARAGVNYAHSRTTAW